MPRYPLEAFCRIEYPSELTYEELIAYETELIPNMEQILAAYNAVHVDVFPDGDELKVQCAFAALPEPEFDALAHDLAGVLGKCVEARLLLLPKNLQQMRIARFMDKRTRIETIPL